MKKITCYSLLTVFIVLLGCKTKELVQVSEPLHLDNSLLWTITDDEIADTSYLFGTIHIIPEEDFFWPEGILYAIDNSEEVIFEIDMDDMNDMSKQMALLPKLVMKNGIGLKDLLSLEDYKFVKQHFTDMGIPFFFLEKLKPMFLMIFASEDLEMGMGFDGSGIMSYEMEIYEKANASNIEVGGLETIEYQVSVFDSIPYERQAEMLVEAIKAGDSEDGTMEQMIELYKQQDINGLVISMDEDDNIKDFENILNHDRNKNWIPQIEEKIRSRSTFFAVGAGHLGGDKGVISLLRKAGYSVEAY